MAYTAAENETAAIAALDEFPEARDHCCEYWLGALYAFRGDAAAAFSLFESAWEDREAGLLDIKVDPLLESIRNDPRYNELLSRLNLD